MLVYIVVNYLAEHAHIPPSLSDRVPEQQKPPQRTATAIRQTSGNRTTKPQDTIVPGK
jgi:hypothetical protein